MSAVAGNTRAMTSVSKFLLLLLLLLAYSYDAAAICKWTDRNGTTHYAEKCPESENPTQIDIEPPPGQDEAQASQQRAEQMHRATRAGNSQRELLQELQSLEDRGVTNMTAATLRQCAMARQYLATLDENRPVYLDETGALHSRNSAHNASYKGPRQYLDEQQRASAIKRFEQVEAETCNASESDIRERVRALAKERNEGVCGQLEVRLAEVKTAGASREDIRFLEQLLDSQCR
jgi:hypothetical protein